MLRIYWHSDTRGPTGELSCMLACKTVTRGLPAQPWMTWGLLYRLGGLLACSNPPASASPVFGVQACVAMASCKWLTPEGTENSCGRMGWQLHPSPRVRRSCWATFLQCLCYLRLRCCWSVDIKLCLLVVLICVLLIRGGGTTTANFRYQFSWNTRWFR